MICATYSNWKSAIIVKLQWFSVVKQDIQKNDVEVACSVSILFYSSGYLI